MTRQENKGYTLLEVMIAVTITALLLAVVFTIGSEVLAYTDTTDREFDVQYEANRAFRRTSEVLRKTGWNTDGGTTYPAVAVDEDEIQFQILEDIDGNGYPFDQTTGELEWNTAVFTIRRDPDDETLYVFDGDTPVWTLGRHIQEVRFITVQQDATLHFKEVRVEITAATTTREGSDLTYTASGSIHMRN